MSADIDNIDYNKIADSLFYEKGLNIFPIDNGKVTYEPRSEYKEAPIPDEIHEDWKATGRYSKGIVLMPGPVFRGENQGLWFVGIDLDREPGVKEFCNIFGVTSIDELKDRFMIEQHDKNPNSSHPDSYHIYFYSQIPFTDLKSDIMEICSNGKYLMCTTPSYHYETNSRWRIIGTDNPEILTSEQANKIMNDINEVCKKNNVSYLDQFNYNYNGNDHGNGHGSSNYNYSSTLSEELKEVCYSLKIPIQVPIKNSNSLYIIRNGTRHNFLLSIANTLLFYHKPDRNKNVSYDQLKDFLFEVNNVLCEVKYPENDLNRIWTDALDNYDKNKPSPVDDDNDDSGKYTSNSKISVFKKLSPEVQQQLSKFVCWAHTSITQPKFIIAHKDFKQIILASIKKYDVLKKDGEGHETKSYLNLSDIIIDAIPVKITRHKDLLGLSSENYHKYTIEFVTKSNKKLNVGPKYLDEIIAYLKNMMLVQTPAKAPESLSTIISAFEEDGKIIEKSDVETPGFYYIDEEIRHYHVKHPKPTIEEIKSCCESFDILQSKFKKKDILPTVLKWSAMAPFDYVLKQIHKDAWMEWIYLYGTSNTGKSSLGEKICNCIWDRYQNVDAELPSTAIDTEARLGESLSKSTYPIVINEVSHLSDIRTGKKMVEMIKLSIAGLISRKKFGINKTNWTAIPSLSACILTANNAPPDDKGLKRRIISIDFTEDDKYSNEEIAEFDKIFKEQIKKELRYFGDFAVNYIMENQHILIGNNSVDWKEVGQTILTEFYKAAGREAPEWIQFFVERIQLEDSKTDTGLLLRSFLIDRINDAYSRHYRSTEKIIIDSSESNAERDKISFSKKLTFCLDNGIIPFLRRIDTGWISTIVFTSDLINELKQKIPDIASLSGVASYIDGFEYGQQRITKKQVLRVAYGTEKDLLEFLGLE
jgi:hypothetical protein